MSTPKVTAIFEHRSDGRAYVVVTHGAVVEHLRIFSLDEAPKVVAREFPQITLAEAERQCAEVRKA
jgi:hypothetical protein